MSTKHLGEISRIELGIGGIRDSMLGLFIWFTYDDVIVMSENSISDPTLVNGEGISGTEGWRDKRLARIMREISKILNQAKVSTLQELKGKPVELEIDEDEGYRLLSWRLLTEVI